MITALLTLTALAGSPEGTLNTEGGFVLGFRPGASLQADYGVWKGFYVGGRITSQQEAYWAAGNLGEFEKTGTWHHGLHVGGGIRAVLGRNDRWDVDVGVFWGPQFSFVREQVRYDNSGQDPAYTITDRRQYVWGLATASLGLPFPTLRYRFADNHGIVIQPMYPVSHPIAIEYSYMTIGWTARWGGDKVGSGGDERVLHKRKR